MTEGEDLGLEVLKDANDALGCKVDNELIESLFKIQQKHQFNNDRSASINAMDAVIEEWVDQLSANQVEAESDR